MMGKRERERGGEKDKREKISREAKRERKRR